MSVPAANYVSNSSILSGRLGFSPSCPTVGYEIIARFQKMSEFLPSQRDTRKVDISIASTTSAPACQRRTAKRCCTHTYLDLRKLEATTKVAMNSCGLITKLGLKTYMHPRTPPENVILPIRQRLCHRLSRWNSQAGIHPGDFRICHRFWELFREPTIWLPLACVVAPYILVAIRRV